MTSHEVQVEIPVKGMDCAECTMHVQHAIGSLHGVRSVQVYLASEKAMVLLNPAEVGMRDIRAAVAKAGYSVPDSEATALDNPTPRSMTDISKVILNLFGVVFGAVLFVVVIGEWFGLFEVLTARVPWQLGLVLVAVGGFPVFMNVIRAALRRQIISHTLMTVGVVAALAVGQWATAFVVVFFMRVGDFAERFTTERSRRALKDLTALAPQTARLLRSGAETVVPVSQVRRDDIVIVLPGDVIPVDGEVVAGHATVNQSTLTGESFPVEVGPGATVLASTFAQNGSIRVRVSQVGADTTFGRVIKLVEEAEANRADVQRIADKFSAYYLPVVAGIALLTYLLRNDPLATAAVLVVACSCAFALATPIAMLASIGAAAKRGILIKGGKYIEVLASASVLLVDKTGTLTLGRPQITDVIALGEAAEGDVLRLAASAERYSEHPLARAVNAAAQERRLLLTEPQDFTALHGLGITASVDGSAIKVGNWRMFGDDDASMPAQAAQLQAQGKMLLFVSCNGDLIGCIAAQDTPRAEVPLALSALREYGIKQIELLTGDNENAAAALARHVGISHRANLLPADKINIVKDYQARGMVVVMVGDGVNDAPALAQANVGIAMGAYGSQVAIAAAHIALMRDDWADVPEVFAIARRTMRVVKSNIAFTLLYNTIGLSLAALGILPPIFAAAAQSLPDIGILANSSRLLHAPGNRMVGAKHRM